MHVRMRTIIGLIGLVALVAVGLPALWNHPDLSGLGGSHEAMAGGDVMKEAAQEHVDAAKEYDREAEHHEAEAQRYEQKASAITPLMDPKGYRRDGMNMAADSHRTMANELRFRAKVHRIEAELLMEKGKQTAKEK
ncbi:MAG: hypothetical protein OJF52_000667 [Nitrospira sp.]|nr:MAG: hypothetical protein OJF52_000667 [Nitrospira sp.]